MNLATTHADVLCERGRAVFETHLESALLTALETADAGGVSDEVSAIVRARVREQRSVGVSAAVIARDVRYSAVSSLTPATASMATVVVALRLIDRVVLLCFEEYARAD